MNGMEMMMQQVLKLLGLTPEKIAEMSGMAKLIGDNLSEMNRRQIRIEEKLDRLLALQTGEIAPVLTLTATERDTTNG